MMVFRMEGDNYRLVGKTTVNPRGAGKGRLVQNGEAFDVIDVQAPWMERPERAILLRFRQSPDLLDDFIEEFDQEIDLAKVFREGDREAGDEDNDGSAPWDEEHWRRGNKGEIGET